MQTKADTCQATRPTPEIRALLVPAGMPMSRIRFTSNDAETYSHLPIVVALLSSPQPRVSPGVIAAYRRCRSMPKDTRRDRG